jgi:hypothetical protein
VTGWLNLALGLIQLVNYVMAKLDEAQKQRVWEEARKGSLGKLADEFIEKAKDAGARVDALPDDQLRNADPNSRD